MIAYFGLIGSMNAHVRKLAMKKLLLTSVAALFLATGAAHAIEWQGNMPKPVGKLPPYPPVVCVAPNWKREPCESRQPPPKQTAHADDLGDILKPFWEWLKWTETNWLGTILVDYRPWDGTWPKLTTTRPPSNSFTPVPPTVLLREIPDEFAGTIEVEPGVTLKQLRKDIQDVIDVTIRELKRDGFVVINDNPGGNPYEHWELYQHYGRMNSKVEVRGDCTSACTLIVGAIDKSKICFGPNGELHFHQGRDTRWPDNPVPEMTQWMFDRYPSDIQNWIGKAKNLPMEGFWTLHAEDLWKMGYQKCAD